MYERIFAALDGSRGARLALDEAIRLAHASGGLVVAVCVVSDVPQLTDIDSGYADQRDWNRLATDAASTVLADAEAALQLSGVRGTARAIEASGENVSAALARAATECDADLIVMGTHGRHGIRRALLGSVAESLLRTADRPVLLVRDNADARAAAL
ncbi:universal stress protein A [Burkholderia stagnalis]|uniref:universal stress protein n=1 Tax=Burkholderia stagnalis TaxID=1503054 RepID=UPI00076002D4|nr:universal stress protein [Burkholderia stagnalis]KWK51277.1 universal stress protein A [Burkholderia stagnalis]KWK53096.1 universal stress protein A [Burkholderia stagnalis]